MAEGQTTLRDLLGNPSRCNLLSLFLSGSDSKPMKEILPLCSGGSLTCLTLSLFCWKLPSWSFSLKESSFWIFILLGQIWRDDSHFLSSLFSFFSIPLFFFFFLGELMISVLCARSNLMQAKKIMFCLLGWCYETFRNIKACYKSSIIKNYLLFLQPNKYTLSILLLTLVQIFLPTLFPLIQPIACET